LNGSFGTYVFLGDFDDNAAMYKFQPTWAGFMYVFAAPTEMCDNCGVQEEQAFLVSDTIPITPMLLDYKKTGELPSLGAVDVVEFLKSKLKWRVVRVRLFVPVYRQTTLTAYL
jgi:tyrosinase